MPPRKRSCFFVLGSRYEIRETFTTRSTGGRRIDYGFVSTLEAKARQRGIGEVGYGIRDTCVDPKEAVLEIAPITIGEIQHQVHKTCFQMQQAEMVDLQETNRRRQAQMVENLRVMGDMRREMGDMQAELLALREQPRRVRQLGLNARVPDHQDDPRDADSNI
nr:hypothetical protein [Tanacetum cinerariifolium]